MKIIFFGTSEFAVPALKALNKSGFEITAVVTTPDQPAGRKKAITPPPIKIAADFLKLKILQPTKLRDNSLFEEFKSLAPDLCIVAAYGKIIPEEYLSVPKQGFLNIHPSLLPKYRGPTPIQTAILNGDTETGITILRVDKDVDHGPIFIKKHFSIELGETYQQLHDRLADEGAGLLLEVISNIENIIPEEQNHDQATFTKMLERADGKIDWSRPHQEIYNQIRALNPEPGTWTTWNDRILNIKDASFTKATEGHNEQLKLLIVQLEGKKETSLADFLSGHPDFDISQLK